MASTETDIQTHTEREREREKRQANRRLTCLKWRHREEGEEEAILPSLQRALTLVLASRERGGRSAML